MDGYMTSNANKILEQGYFYNVHGDKEYIISRCEYYMVYKHYSKRRMCWLYRAERCDDFEIYAEKCYTLEPREVLEPPKSYRTVIGEW
jgi:hypothetical protein